ncbi:hypothetical protein XHC_4239 [Xanthomonas hortorum pv. carotae str. M081]|nr:hypothetical protein XHC_4239 [Xanthomonas hortorum pv. carotae str. M081]
MVGVHGCKQYVTCVVWIEVRPISFATQRDQQAVFKEATCNGAHVFKQPANCTWSESSFSRDHRPTFWCGVLAECGTVWRHGAQPSLHGRIHGVSRKSGMYLRGVSRER